MSYIDMAIDANYEQRMKDTWRSIYRGLPLETLEIVLFDHLDRLEHTHDLAPGIRKHYEWKVEVLREVMHER